MEESVAGQRGAGGRLPILAGQLSERAPGHAKLPEGHLPGLEKGITKGGGRQTQETIMKYKGEGQGFPSLRNKPWELLPGFVRVPPARWICGIAEAAKNYSGSQGPFYLQPAREPGTSLPMPAPGAGLGALFSLGGVIPKIN